MSDIDDLIARLNAATEGSHELDAAIYLAINEAWPVANPPRYTTSLDAALTLVPEGMFWNVGNAKLMGAGFQVTVGEPARGLKIGRKWYAHELHPINGPKTAPLAVCIAALRARQADSDQPPTTDRFP